LVLNPNLSLLTKHAKSFDLALELTK